MPSRPKQPAEPPRRPRRRKSVEETTRLLQEQIAVGEELLSRIDPGAYVPGVSSKLRDEYYRWTNYVKELLRSLFDNDEVANEFDFFIGVA
jgi:hypothetical protein